MIKEVTGKGDINQIAKMVVDLATGQAKADKPNLAKEKKKTTKKKNI